MTFGATKCKIWGILLTKSVNTHPVLDLQRPSTGKTYLCHAFVVPQMFLTVEGSIIQWDPKRFLEAATLGAQFCVPMQLAVHPDYSGCYRGSA